MLGNRPSTATYFLEHKDVQYLLQEMAFKTQSRKRTKSWTNLLTDTGLNNKLSHIRDPSQFQAATVSNEDYYEFDSDEANKSLTKNKATPPRQQAHHLHFNSGLVGAGDPT